MRRTVHRAFVAAVFAVAMAAACAGEGPPRYRFREGDVRRYRLAVEEFPLSGAAGETTAARFEYVETIERVADDGAAEIRIDVLGGTREGRGTHRADGLLPPVDSAFRVRIAPDGRLVGGGAVAPFLWLLPTMPEGGEAEWDQRAAFGGPDGIVWHIAARHARAGRSGGWMTLRSALVLLADRHAGGTPILHDPSTNCAACEVVSEGRGVGQTIVDLDEGAVRSAVSEWAVRLPDPGPGALPRVIGRRFVLERLS